MTITFTARHTQITPEIKAYCEKRLKAIRKKTGLCRGSRSHTICRKIQEYH